MAESWIWWIMTCLGAFYFVYLLLEFNKPHQQLIERIDAQEGRHHEMRGRLARVQENIDEMNTHIENLDLDLSELEEKRKELLPAANERRLVLIPAGPFTMGGSDEQSPNTERPAKTVTLSGYRISPFPVTNQDYSEFVNVTGHRIPIHWQRGTFPTGSGRHPVTNVTWQDAMAYATWSGARLPTEAEWEKAARGDDERPFPWGDRFVEGERCNANNMIGTTTPVDEFPDGRSSYGIWDLVGNVYEWCSDFYDAEYYRTGPQSNPPGPSGGQERSVRGGSFQDSRAQVRATHRVGSSEGHGRDNIGFRIVVAAHDVQATAPVDDSDIQQPAAEN